MRKKFSQGTKKPGGFTSTQQKGNIVKGKLKSEKEIKDITGSKKYKDASYSEKNKMLNVATFSKGGRASRKFGSPKNGEKSMKKKYKGFSKLPEKVQMKINKKLAKKV
jgi:hypothetical protein